MEDLKHLHRGIVQIINDPWIKISLDSLDTLFLTSILHLPESMKAIGKEDLRIGIKNMIECNKIIQIKPFLQINKIIIINIINNKERKHHSYLRLLHMLLSSRLIISLQTSKIKIHSKMDQVILKVSKAWASINLKFHTNKTIIIQLISTTKLNKQMKMIKMIIASKCSLFKPWNFHQSSLIIMDFLANRSQII